MAKKTNSTKTTVSSPISTAIKHNKGEVEYAPKADICLLVSVQNSNPNGDPDDEGRPRVDMDDHAIMSAVSIKAKIRSLLKAYADPTIGFFGEEADKNKIFVEKGTIRTQQIVNNVNLDGHKELKTTLTSKGGKSEEEGEEKSSGKKPVPREERAYLAGELCNQFLDIRLFGQCLNDIGAIEGPIQIENAVSVNKVDVVDMCITASQVSSEDQYNKKGDRTMGRSSSVRFALLPIYIHVNGIRAKQNGLTRADYDRFLEILPEVFEQTNSSVRNIQFEKMFVFEHENIRGNMPMKDIRKAVLFEFTKETPTSMDDVKIVVNDPKINSFSGIKFYTK